jgi:hypothetical protein
MNIKNIKLNENMTIKFIPSPKFAITNLSDQNTPGSEELRTKVLVSFK